MFARGFARQDREELRAELLGDIAKEEIGDLVAERDGRIVGAFQIVPVELLERPREPLAATGRSPPRLGSDLSGGARLRRRPRAHGGGLRLGARARPRDDGDRLARDESALVAFLACARLQADVPAALPAHSVVPRIPILVGLPRRRRQRARRRGRAAAAAARPRRSPTSARPSATRCASRSPGEPLEALVTAGGTGDDRRRAAGAAAARARRTTRARRRSRRRSPSSSGSACRRGSRRSSSPAGSRGARASASSRRSSPPAFARRFHGHVEVHDAEAPDLVDARRAPAARRCASTARSSRPISSSAVTRRRDGAARRARRAARGGGRRRRCAPPSAYSLLETAASRGWQLGLALERALAARRARDRRLARAQPRRGSPGLPRLSVRGGRRSSASSRSPLRRFSALLPGGVRRRVLQAPADASSTAVAAFAGPPSVAHAEALLRGIARALGPLDAAGSTRS